MEHQGAKGHVYEYHRDNRLSADCWLARDNQYLPHYHASIEVVEVLAGSLQATLDGQAYNVPQGHLLAVSGYAVHGYQSLEKNSELFLTVPLSFLPTLQKTLQDSAFTVPLLDLNGQDEIRAVLRLLETSWAVFGLETRRGLCHTLISLLAERLGLTPVSQDARKGLVREVLAYLQENYQSDLPMETLAQRFGYSKSRFSHLFNETLGCSPGAFINSLRCQHAARELLAEDRKLLDIALSAGFACPRTFYRVFKQYYGMTPTEYMQTYTRK